MEGTEYITKEAVLKRAQEVIGIPLKDIDKTGRLSTGKGAIGTVIEESWYGYSPNGESEPDFSEAGVELKVTPYIKGKKGDIRAKERLVIWKSMIRPLKQVHFGISAKQCCLCHMNISRMFPKASIR